MMKSNILVWIFTLSFGICFGQTYPTNTLSLEEFLSLVVRFHPVSRQADLIVESGKANLLRARGEFDPNLKSSIDHKNFDGKNYWFLSDNKLEIPTWYGIEVQAGYQYWQGDYFDTHERTPEMGLPFAGLSVSLGKGMFMDDRMAALKQARLFTQITEFERMQVLNRLFLESIQTYLDWTFYYHQYAILDNATSLAYDRYKATVVQFKLGDKPGIDTLEMFTVYQTRLISLLQASNDYKNAQLKLSNFLWIDNNQPVRINDSIVPSLREFYYKNTLFNADSLNELKFQLFQRNPELNQLNLQRSQLKIDKTLKVNKLLPEIDLTYNFLYNDNLNSYFVNNYKFGAQFKMPLFLRKERGELRLTKLKIQDIGLKQDLKSVELMNKVEMYYNDYQANFNQLSSYYTLLDNYKRLLDAETTKFQLGESTVFMINSRETKYLETLIKVKEIETKVVKSYFGIYGAAGLLAER